MEEIAVITGVIGTFIAFLTFMSKKKEKDIHVNVNINDNILVKDAKEVESQNLLEKEDNVDKIFSFIKRYEENKKKGTNIAAVLGIAVGLVSFVVVPGEISILIGVIVFTLLNFGSMISKSSLDKLLRSNIVALRMNKEEIEALLIIVENYSWVESSTRRKALKTLNKFL